MKRYTVALCVDDEGGMTFNNRRQSRDRVLLAELCSSANGRVYVSPFSTSAFPDRAAIYETQNPFTDAPAGAVLFIENIPLAPHINEIERLIVYRWNKCYPKDSYLDVDPLREGFSLESSVDFAGSSHDKITKETYTR